MDHHARTETQPIHMDCTDETPLEDNNPQDALEGPTQPATGLNSEVDHQPAAHPPI
jgi:hypothetical protein